MMISSAVVIPEQSPSNEAQSPPSLKRRQSSQSPEGNKRPRLESFNGNGNRSSPPIPSAMSPPRRKSSLLTGNEEKKRGQRLFGSLLGTLSQTSSKPAHRKRDEIEKRQQERLRRDDEEREEERKRKKDELDIIRREEQKVWDKESTRLRFRNMKAMAGFLRTKTEPRLYYKPWQLRPDEEQQIKKQLEKVEETIRDGQLKEQSLAHTSSGNVKSTEDVKDEVSLKSGDAIVQNGVDAPPTPKESNFRIQQEEQDQSVGSRQQLDVQASKTEEEPKPSTEDKSKEDDHGGGELVEGHEDDVIY